ncbi:MAG: hypothetical protein JW800_04705 [Candidatus Omnitrophica bacterium]|nr:hypothetical protein [Candidatus Omnitrophota bacterium]
MPTGKNEKDKVNPGLSAVLSFLFSGLGQIYNGEISKGLYIMSGSACGMVLVIIGTVQLILMLVKEDYRLTPILMYLLILTMGVLIIAVIGIYNLYDAYNSAKKKSEV